MNINSRITLQSLKSIEKIVGGKLTLGKLLWAIRKSEEITQVNFSKQLNISKQHLCDIERDRKTVSPKLAADTPSSWVIQKNSLFDLHFKMN